MREGDDKINRRQVLGGLAAMTGAALLRVKSEAAESRDDALLRGPELGKARYDFFRKDLDDDRKSYKAYMNILDGANKPIFNESVCVFLESDTMIRIQGRDFEFTLKADGTQTGTMPAHVQEFLQFEKEAGGKFINKHFGQGGAMGVNYTESCDPLVS